jgi:LysM repeat protein
MRKTLLSTEWTNQMSGGSTQRVSSIVALASVAGILMATPAHASSVNWDAIASCESGNDWSINTGNGFYGGLQFTLSTWRSNGGSGMPQNASRSEQIRVAENVLSSQGIGAWPVCGKLGGSSKSYSTQSYTSHTAVNKKYYKPVTTAPKTYKPVTKPAATAVPKYIAPCPNHILVVDYTVQNGDSLSAIAVTYHTTWENIYNDNLTVIGSNPDLIYPGQVLKIYSPAC